MDTWSPMWHVLHCAGIPRWWCLDAAVSFDRSLDDCRGHLMCKSRTEDLCWIIVWFSRLYLDWVVMWNIQLDQIFAVGGVYEGWNDLKTDREYVLVTFHSITRPKAKQIRSTSKLKLSHLINHRHCFQVMGPDPLRWPQPLSFSPIALPPVIFVIIDVVYVPCLELSFYPDRVVSRLSTISNRSINCFVLFWSHSVQFSVIFIVQSRYLFR